MGPSGRKKAVRCYTQQRAQTNCKNAYSDYVPPSPDLLGGHHTVDQKARLASARQPSSKGNTDKEFFQGMNVENFPAPVGNVRCDEKGRVRASSEDVSEPIA